MLQTYIFFSSAATKNTIFALGMTKVITPYQQVDQGKKKQVAQMFNNISGTYDFLNHFLSLGIDVIWRKRAIRTLKELKPKHILDVATGTGDFAIQAAKTLNPEHITGVDISQGMLEVGRQKVAKKQLSRVITMEIGDSENLPFESACFDAVTVAFGVRNFEHIEAGMAEIYRVLRPGGKLVILEFTTPRYFPVKQLYRCYFKYITPAIGRLFSKDRRAYSYLPESVEAFYQGQAFVDVLKQSGFHTASHRPQTFGICGLYTALK